MAHGVTLLTQDVDVCCRLGADNLLRIQSALADLHPVHRMPPQRPALMRTPKTAAEFRNLYLETDSGAARRPREVSGGPGPMSRRFEESTAKEEIELAAGSRRDPLNQRADPREDAMRRASGLARRSRHSGQCRRADQRASAARNSRADGAILAAIEARLRRM